MHFICPLLIFSPRVISTAFFGRPLTLPLSSYTTEKKCFSGSLWNFMRCIYISSTILFVCLFFILGVAMLTWPFSFESCSIKESLGDIHSNASEKSRKRCSVGSPAMIQCVICCVIWSVKWFLDFRKLVWMCFNKQILFEKEKWPKALDLVCKLKTNTLS